MMDLGQLRSFAHVAERGTVVAAAAALDFTPPAISQHVAKLETEVGAPLFDRVGRRLHLTDAGRALLPLALQMIDLDRQARQSLRLPSARPHFVVAGFASAIATLLIPRLDALDQHMTLEIVESEDADALRELRLGTVDMVLTQEYEGMLVDRDPRLIFTPLAADRLRLVVPAEMPSSTTIEALADAAWLVNGRGTRCAEATMRVLRAAGVSPSISAVVADNETLLGLVAAGHGVTIVPDLLLTTPRPRITVAAQDLGVSRTILAVNRAGSSAAIAPLRDLIALPSA